MTKHSPTSVSYTEAAQKLGMSRNEMILKAVAMMISFDVTFYKKLEAYSNSCKVPISTAVQNTIIKRWAQDNAKKAVWGSNKEILIEFSLSGEGIIQPKELYELVYQMTFGEETKKRFEELQEEVNQGIELRGEEKDFYEEFKPKYGYKPIIEKQSLKEGRAFWEGEESGEK